MFQFRNFDSTMAPDTIRKNGMMLHNHANRGNRAKRTSLFIMAFCFCVTLSWGETWKLTNTMTVTLDIAGVLTISTTALSEEMPNLSPWSSVRPRILSIVIGDKVTTICDDAFYYCENLRYVTISNSVKTIGNQSFEHCENLISVTIGESVTTIGNRAFRFCRNLTSITIPNSVTTLGDNVFGNCYNLTTATIGNAVTTLGYSTFSNCMSLESVTIGNSVKTIGDLAFLGCISLISVTIPNSVTSVGEYAFGYCTSLNDVTVKWTTPLSVPASIFDDVPAADATLHVLNGTKALYAATDVWRTFGIIEEMIENPVAVETVHNPIFSARFVGDVLRIESPQAESVTVYSISGVQLYSSMKNAGITDVTLPSQNGSIFIVKGSVSGIVKVLKQNWNN